MRTLINRRRLITQPMALIITTGISALLISCYSDAHAAKKGGTISGNVSIFVKKTFGGRQAKSDLAGTVVYLSGFKTRPPVMIKEIVQKQKRFVPKIVPIVAGQTIRFPNQDPIYHNVFSISPRSTFDLGQYKGSTAPKTVTFNEYGVVPIYCNIHPEMIAYVVVLENDAFDLTKADGTFSIGPVPDGEFTINAWRPKAKRVKKKISIHSGQRVVVTLEMMESIRIKAHHRKDGSRYPTHGEVHY